MAVWLTMSMSHVGQGSSANTAEIYVSVNVHWDAKHYNRDGGALSVTVDGSTYNYSVPFNAGETSSGSQNLYSAYWTVSHTSSRTVYGYATFQATNATTATPASAEVYLSGSGGSGGGSSGGDSGGGDDDYDDDDDGGSSGGGDTGGGNSGGVSYDYVYTLFFDVGAYCSIMLYENGVFLDEVRGSYYLSRETNRLSTFTFEPVVFDGYKLSSFYIKGVSYLDAGIGSLTPKYGEYNISATAMLDVDIPDGNDQDWVIGDSYDANEPPRTKENSPDGSHYILVRQGEGTKLTVTRIYTESGGYIGELINGESFQDEYGTWYKYAAGNDDYFTIEAEALPGYNIDGHNINGKIFNFYASGIAYEPYYSILDGGWNFDGNDRSEVARVYSSATKNNTEEDYGSGSGVLYFDAAECEAQYAVEFSYIDNKFYVTRVKLKTPKYGPYNTEFDLFIKINDAVIHSGKTRCRIDTADWYDLNISGLTGITNTVKITLLGTAEFPGFTYSVASPTVQTIVFRESDPEDGGGDDGDDPSGDVDLDEYYLIYIRTEGATCNISREYTEGDESYIGYLSPDFTENYGDTVFEYYRIWYHDEFSVQINANSGYELESYLVDGHQFEYEMYGMEYDAIYDVWVFNDPRDYHPVLSFKATKLASESSNAILIESEFGSDEYTPYIYTEVGYPEYDMAYQYVPYSVYYDTGYSWELLV